MAKLYFKYGAMGSSKTAQALITKFNYEERGMKVCLLKPAADTRDGHDIIRSRIGLTAKAQIVTPEQSIIEIIAMPENDNIDVVIVDEAQFLTTSQVDELRFLVSKMDLPVICFGLRTDFLTHMFPGSKRLMELAESITEIKTICKCGAKAIVNARLSPEGKVLTSGEQVFLGGNESYVAMCHKCWQDAIDNNISVTKEE